MRRPRWTVAWLALLVLAGSVRGAEKTYTRKFTVEAGKHERRNTPLKIEVLLPFEGKLSTREVVLKDSDGKVVPAQMALPKRYRSVVAVPLGHTRVVLHWVLPRLDAGSSTTFTATFGQRSGKSDRARGGFAWRDTAGRHADILRDGRPVIRYMYKAYDNDPGKRDLDNKPFHHMYDPHGSRIVTKGTGGLYTHHQGLFYGFTRCTFPGGQCNTWYCHDGEHLLHREVVDQVAGPVFASHCVVIDWNDKQGKPFCREQRELTVFGVGGGTLVEWWSRLESVRGTVTLDGDAQHAGFQFRADNEVAERQKEKLVYYLRPDGQGDPGATRNPVRGKGADDPANRAVVNMPWHVMSFVLGKQRYTAAYLDSPHNPKPSFSSERAYGRFGGWFGKQTLKAAQGDSPANAITLTYRVWLQRGEMTAEQASRLAADFAEPPKVTVSKAR